MNELDENAIGLTEGEELPNEHGTEVVVYDRDESGAVVGWHKELKESI
jgi:hypothetical protein